MSQAGELIRQLAEFSYLGIFGVSLISNVILPVPEEIILLALGYLAGTGRVNGFILVPIVILGLLISDIIMYTLSKRGNKLVNFFYNKFFARRLSERRAWLLSHIEKVIFFSRFMVQLRFLGPFLAGQTKVPFQKFLKYELLALFVYVPFYIWAGGYFQNRIDFITDGIGTARNIILVFIGIVILISISKFGL